MATITYQRVRIQGGLGLFQLENLEVHVKPNTHAVASFSGFVDASIGFSELEEQLETKEIKIIELDEDGNPTDVPIFSGLVKSVVISYDAGVYIIHAELISGSYLLDTKKKSRSFQDKNMTYEDVVNLVLQDTPSAHAIFTVGQGVPIQKPLIQYLETDWEFIRRLASHFGSSITPEIKDGKPHFWFGMREGSDSAELAGDKYTSAISDRFYSQGEMERPRSDYLYYKVRDTRNYTVGDPTGFKNQGYVICEKHAHMERGELIFTYHVGKKRLTGQKKYYNDKICGMSLIGTVLETKRETVKIHLDIDEYQDVGTAYPYKWAPTTNNIEYCMPKVGTRVSLYFFDRDEHSARAVNCVRTNGDTWPEMEDYNYRYFTTEHNKRLYLFPESMGLVGVSDNPDVPLHIAFLDELGHIWESDKKLWILAKEEISIESDQTIVIRALEELTLTQTDNGVSLNMNNQHDIFGDNTRIIGRDFAPFENLVDAPEDEEAFDGGGLLWDILGGIASFAKAVADTAKKIGETLWEGAKAALAVLGAVPVIAGISAALAAAASAVASTAASVASALTSAASIVTTAIGSFVGAVTGALSSAAIDVTDALGDIADDLLGGLAFSTDSGGGFRGGGAGRGHMEKVWTGKDKYVSELANVIESKYPGRVKGVEKIIHSPTGRIITDLDIELDGLVIQVKSGNAKGLTRQMVTTANATGAQVISYTPDISLNAAVLRGVRDAGFETFNNMEDLLYFLESIYEKG